MLKKFYDDECLSRTQDFERFKTFEKRREKIGDDQSPGRRNTSKSGANIENVGEIFRQIRCLNIRAFSELINIGKEPVRQIVHNNYSMNKVCSKMMPRLFNPEQNEIRMTFLLTFFKTLKRPELFIEHNKL